MLSFSLRSFFLAVTFFAVSCVAFYNASAFWVSATLSAAIVLLVFAILAVVASRNTSRIFWLGFAIVGCLYLVSSVGPWFETNIEPKLLTTSALEYVYPMIKREVPVGKTRLITWSPSESHFKVVGHQLLTVALACLGGLTARHLHAAI